MSNYEPGGDDAASCYLSQITDAMWAVIGPLLPGRAPRRGGRGSTRTVVLNAIFYVLRLGCQRRMVPAT